MPLLVAPPGSTGSSVNPPSHLRVNFKASFNVIGIIFPFSLPLYTLLFSQRNIKTFLMNTGKQAAM
jgi:hypothetical protein